MLTATLLEAAAQNTFPDFARKDSLQFALRTSYSFDHDNATANHLISLAGGSGIIPFYRAIEDNDRVFAEIQYNY